MRTGRAKPLFFVPPPLQLQPACDAVSALRRRDSQQQKFISTVLSESLYHQQLLQDGSRIFIPHQQPEVQMKLGDGETLFPDAARGAQRHSHQPRFFAGNLSSSSSSTAERERVANKGQTKNRHGTDPNKFPTAHMERQRTTWGLTTRRRGRKGCFA